MLLTSEQVIIINFSFVYLLTKPNHQVALLSINNINQNNISITCLNTSLQEGLKRSMHQDYVTDMPTSIQNTQASPRGPPQPSTSQEQLQRVSLQPSRLEQASEQATCCQDSTSRKTNKSKSNKNSYKKALKALLTPKHGSEATYQKALMQALGGGHFAKLDKI